MNNLCPNCGSGYNLSAAHVGRQFACKKCGDTLLVTADGLRSSRAPSASAELAGYGSLPAFPTAEPANTGKRPIGNNLGDFLTFRRMILPLLLQVFFWVGILACVYFGFSRIIEIIRANLSTQKTLENVLSTVFVYMIFCPILVRVYCEVLIVIYRMNETLTDIKDILERHPR